VVDETGTSRGDPGRGTEPQARGTPYWGLKRARAAGTVRLGNQPPSPKGEDQPGPSCPPERLTARHRPPRPVGLHRLVNRCARPSAGTETATHHAGRPHHGAARRPAGSSTPPTRRSSRPATRSPGQRQLPSVAHEFSDRGEGQPPTNAGRRNRTPPPMRGASGQLLNHTDRPAQPHVMGSDRAGIARGSDRKATTSSSAVRPRMVPFAQTTSARPTGVVRALTCGRRSGRGLSGAGEMAGLAHVNGRASERPRRPEPRVP